MESGYHFIETDIESRFQQLHASLKRNEANISALELDNAEYENEQAREEINALYEIFTREIEAHKVVEKLIKTCLAIWLTLRKQPATPKEIERLSQTFLLSDTETSHVKELQAELSAQEDVVLSAVEDSSETKQAFLWFRKSWKLSKSV